eukprot:CAMPEP_0169411912 /NCGR_PEP_ID=MMETSP1017-20121227/60547_1 /TAXON_ID=342587 /ORGANISM="Karlodinium micrum, Strain CCMP2283" /LENGTH=145 /DNA_ID=CAMNT_0009519235 /DNA_START=704 /DNA_END=1142 /DNA_ORIENTATION=-
MRKAGSCREPWLGKPDGVKPGGASKLEPERLLAIPGVETASWPADTSFTFVASHEQEPSFALALRSESSSADAVLGSAAFQPLIPQWPQMPFRRAMSCVVSWCALSQECLPLPPRFVEPPQALRARKKPEPTCKWRLSSDGDHCV